jgi:hypothetical protein
MRGQTRSMVIAIAADVVLLGLFNKSRDSETEGKYETRSIRGAMRRTCQAGHRETAMRPKAIIVANFNCQHALKPEADIRTTLLLHALHTFIYQVQHAFA